MARPTTGLTGLHLTHAFARLLDLFKVVWVKGCQARTLPHA